MAGEIGPRRHAIHGITPRLGSRTSWGASHRANPASQPTTSDIWVLLLTIQ